MTKRRPGIAFDRMRPRTSPVLLGSFVVMGLGFLLPLPAGGEPRAWGWGSAPPQEACEAASADLIEDAFHRLKDLHGLREARVTEDIRARGDSLVSEAMALHVAGERIFGPRDWDELGPHRREEFARAMTRYLRNALFAFLARNGGSVRDLQASREPGAEDNGAVVVDFWLIHDHSTEPLTFRMARRSDGTCGIADVVGAGGSLVGTLSQEVDDLLDEYSFPYMIAEIGDYGYVVLEDFERTPVGQIPVGWGWKDKDDDSHKPYRVRREDANKYLEATDRGESVILGRKVSWNLDRYPLVSFRVRVNRIPEGADERYDDRVDSAAGIYFTVNRKMFGLIPESVKYVWSSTLPVGGAAIRDGIGRPWQVVFGSGTDDLGEWRTYVFDLRQAYRDTFGGDPPSRPLGIGILSDANSMDAEAFADYDDIRALERPPAGIRVTSGVEEILRGG